MEVGPSEKAIARHLEAVFQTRPRIFMHRESENDPFYAGIARVADFPDNGMVTMSTIGASNSPLFQEDGSEYPATRVEFIASCKAGQEEDLGEALFRAAVFVGKAKGFARPGIFLHNLIGQFRPVSPVPHGFLTAQFAYDNLGQPNNFADWTVSWLQVLPVSSSEIDYAQERSTDALEELFEAQEIEWDSLDRASAV